MNEIIYNNEFLILDSSEPSTSKCTAVKELKTGINFKDFCDVLWAYSIFLHVKYYNFSFVGPVEQQDEPLPTEATKKKKRKLDNGDESPAIVTYGSSKAQKMMVTYWKLFQKTSVLYLYYVQLLKYFDRSHICRKKWVIKKEAV